MSIIDRMPDESPGGYAQRMVDLVGVIEGLVSAEAGQLIDVDDTIANARFIAEHADGPDWDECWQLQLDIRRVISRMTSPTRLDRVLYFAREMAR